MSKRNLICILLMLLMLICPKVSAEEDTIMEIIPEEIGAELSEMPNQEDTQALINFFSFDTFWNMLVNAINKYLPEFTAMTFSILVYVLSFAFLDQISFRKTKASYSIVISCLCSTLMMIILYRYFSKACEMIGSSLETAQIFCNASVPIMTALLIEGGKPLSASLFSYVVSLSGNIITTLTNNLFMPLIRIMLAIGACCGIWNDVHFSSAVQTIEKFIKWLTGIVFSVFTLAMSMQSILVKSGDSTMHKLVKSAAGSIPVMGSLISKGVESAFTIAGSVNSATGIIGIVVIITIFSGPAVSLMLQSVAIYIGVSVSQLFGQKDSMYILKVVHKAYLLMIGLFIMSVVMCGICFLIMCLGAS